MAWSESNLDLGEGGLGPRPSESEKRERRAGEPFLCPFRIG